MKIIKAKKPVKKRIRCGVCNKILRKNRSVFSVDYECNNHPIRWSLANSWNDCDAFRLGNLYVERETDGTIYGQDNGFVVQSSHSIVRHFKEMHVSNKRDDSGTIIEWLTTMTVFS